MRPGRRPPRSHAGRAGRAGTGPTPPQTAMAADAVEIDSTCAQPWMRSSAVIAGLARNGRRRRPGWSRRRDRRRIRRGRADHCESGSGRRSPARRRPTPGVVPVPVVAVGRPQRRQVHAGQPDPRQPPGGGARTPRASPATGSPTTPTGAGGRSRWSTPAAGSRPRRGALPRSPRRSPRRPGWRSRRPTRSCSWSTPTVGITDADDAVAAVLRRSGKPVCWPPTRSTTRRASRPRPRCGRSGSASRCPVSALHGRGSGDLLDAVLGALPEAAGRALGPSRAARAGSR